MDGQSCEIVLQSFVTADQARKYLCNPFHLKRLAFEMTRAKRQYMLFARSEWLEEGSDESRKLLDTFRSHGRIIGPNDLLKLKHHTQIYEMQAKILMMVRRRRFAEERKKNFPDRTNNFCCIYFFFCFIFCNFIVIVFFVTISD